jgi:DNA helicase-2/ATP-dependent DNA helicase PcrA
MLTLLDGLDRHLIAPDDLISASPDSLPDDPDTWLKRVDLARVTAAYRAEKQRLGLVEFSDLIANAVALVTQHPSIAEELGSRYDIVLLDEYQDTDPAQRMLLTAVFGEATAVTAVGDSDQTIYEWRGASLDNFEAFPDHFPRADGRRTETLPLSLNRRSDRVIIDLANTIKADLPSIDGSEPLVPMDEAPAGSLRVGWFVSERDEAAWIAEDIQRQHHNGTAYSNIAILVRKRAWIPMLVAALREFDVPTSVSDPGTLLTVPEVADVVAWLRIVADPDDEPALLRILVGGQYRLGLADLDALRRHAKTVRADSLMGAISVIDEVDDLDPGARNALERFAVIHETLMRFGQANTVATTINRIITTIGFWDETAALPPGEATSARLNIARFVNVASGWRPIEGRPTVGRFLRYIDALDASGRDDALTPPTTSAADAVELTTIHGAKGLEWDSVYLPGLVHDAFPMGSRRHDDPDRHAMLIPYEMRLDAASLTDLITTTGKQRETYLKERNAHSENRLAYVAVTRAKHALTMTGHVWQDHLTRPKKPSPYLLKARDLANHGEVEWVGDDVEAPHPKPFNSKEPTVDPLFPDGVADALRATIADAGAPLSMRPDLADAVAQRTQQLALEIADLSEPHTEAEAAPFATAVTNLVTLAQCPLKFKWVHHDRLPRRPSNAAIRGTEFHRKIELHNLGVIALDEPTPETYDTVEIDDVADVDVRSARVDPWAVFEASRFADLKARFSETPFEIAIGQGSVRGKIDAIYEPEPGVWEIVDYKSGRPSDDSSRLVQLKAYAIAVADGAVSVDTPESLSVSFAYFGADEAVEVTETVDEKWLDRARSELESLIDVGADGPWNPTPSDACRYCDFQVHCEPGKAWLKDRKTS